MDESMTDLHGQAKILENAKHSETYRKYLTIIPKPHDLDSDIQSISENDDLFSFTRKSPDENQQINTTDPATSPDPIYPDLSSPESAPVYPDAEQQAENENREKRLRELEKIEEEIGTLRQVLTAKEQQASELKRELGINTMGQIKAELTKVQNSQVYQTTQAKVSDLNEKVTTSEYYKKTSETLKTAGHATESFFNTVGTSVSAKFSEMKNSPTYKSFEERVEGVGSTIMAKVSGAPRDPSASTATTPGDSAPVTTQPQHTDEVPM